MMGEIGRTLKDLQFGGPVGRQVVLVGGGADLKGIADYTQSALGRAARIGRPRGLHGLPDAHSGPAFATPAGPVLYAASDPVELPDLPIMAQDKHPNPQRVAWGKRGAGTLVRRGGNNRH